MSYSAFLGKAKKGSKIVKIEEDGYESFDDSVIDEIYELGKNINWRQKDSKNIINNEDEELYIVNKDFLLFIIEEYRLLNHAYIQNLSSKIKNTLKQFESKDKKIDIDNNHIELFKELSKYFNHKQHSWTEHSCNINLDNTKSNNITSSWHYEYAIFNLVHILHTFDWENDDLILYFY